MNTREVPQYTSTIGVFAEHFQGPFTGELVNQIRQLCQLRNIRFIGYSTGSLGDFNCDLSLQQLDGAIIIRNSISNELARKLLSNGVSTVSISYDYFPLDIPVVDIDNSKSVELVFEHFHQYGHKTVAFVGDLRRYDTRKRYERYLELMDSYGLDFDDDLLINVSKSGFGGGIQAAMEFLQRGCNSKAVIIGSCQMAIGFVNCLREHGVKVEHQIDVVAYGATPLVQAICPVISTVDQNIHLVAYRALSTVMDCISGDNIDKDALVVMPKLILSEEITANENSPYLASSVDIAEIYEPNYVSSLMNNNHLWSQEIYASNLENLMSIAPVFSKYMNEASFARVSKAAKGAQIVKVLKKFSVTGANVLDPRQRQNICEAKQFPPDAIADTNAYSVVSHFFVKSKDSIHAVISLYGSGVSATSCSSYLFMAGQMESLTQLLGLQIENLLLQNYGGVSANKSNTATANVPLHQVLWDIKGRVTEWSKEALSMLGMSSPMDVNIYQNMELTDRIHQDDIDYVRHMLADCAANGDNFCTTFRIKNKSGEFVSVALQAETLSEHGEVLQVKLNMGLLDQD